MDLGAFSMGLAVRALEAPRRFHEQLGFVPFFGDARQNGVILRNGDHPIGLFQGNPREEHTDLQPAWDSSANPVGSFTDIRAIQRTLKANGIAFVAEVDEAGSEPGSVVVLDPDGNPIFVDQHV